MPAVQEIPQLCRVSGAVDSSGTPSTTLLRYGVDMNLPSGRFFLTPCRFFLTMVDLDVPMVHLDVPMVHLDVPMVHFRCTYVKLNLINVHL